MPEAFQFFLLSRAFHFCTHIIGNLLLRSVSTESHVTGTLEHEQNSSSHSDGARSFNMWKGHASPSFLHRSIKKNLLYCLEGREIGSNWSQACSNGGYVGRNCERWTPFLEGMFVLVSRQ
jgi:hypothetical protein